MRARAFLNVSGLSLRTLPRLAVALAPLVVTFATGTAAAEPAAPADGPRGPAAALRAPQADPEAPIVTIIGEGEPTSTVIFMHGLGGSPKGSLGLPRALVTPPANGSVRVVSIWMRPIDGQHTMTDQLARARRAIEAEPGPVTLMGHSFGGKAALNLAKMYPAEKVTGIVALAPSVNMLQSYWKRLTGERVLPEPEVVEPQLANIEKQLEQRVKNAEATGDKKKIREARENLAYARTMRDLVHHDEPGTETTVTRPTLVLHGSEDEAVSIHYARRFADANANVEFVEIPGANHGFNGEDEEATIANLTAMRKPIRAFMAKTAGVRPPAAVAQKAAAPQRNAAAVNATLAAHPAAPHAPPAAAQPHVAPPRPAAPPAPAARPGVLARLFGK